MEEENQCRHGTTHGRKNERGYFCIYCGEKVMDVETRPCKECKHYRIDIHGRSLCSKLLMSIVPEMNVTFYINKGTCFEN